MLERSFLMRWRFWIPSSRIARTRSRDCPEPESASSWYRQHWSRLGLQPDVAHPYLDLVAISIASDIVPIVDENRILMREGLKRSMTGPRTGHQGAARSHPAP
jgi:single-stranded DNA-specific DHH superfamily exonuclease